MTFYCDIINSDFIKLEKTQMTDFEKDKMRALCDANSKANLEITPTFRKFINKYTIESFVSSFDSKNPPKCVAFWHEYEENGIFSQWHKTSFECNGRKYVTAEQYMMSEKALLFEDFDSYKKIMREENPQECKRLGKLVKNFDQAKWNKVFREIIFTGNFLRAQHDIDFLDALLETGDDVLIEASPLDDIYGAGIEAKDLLDSSGFLKLPPDKWICKRNGRQGQNNLGFALMGVREWWREVLG